MFEFEKTRDPFFNTPNEIALKKLEVLDLKNGETLLDLGSGDGNVLIQASKIAKVNCIGYETLPEALSIAKNTIQQASLQDHIVFINEDMFKADLSNVNAVILYLTRNVLGRLSFKLEEELPKGARVVTHDFDVPGWEATKEISFNTKNGRTRSIYLYHR